MSTLFLNYWIEDNDLFIFAWDEQEVEEELRLQGEGPLLFNHIATVYDILEGQQTERLQEFNDSLAFLSERLLKPFAQHIDTHTLIRFMVSLELIKAPLDLLLHRDQYLFLQRQVCYQIDIGLVDDEPVLDIQNALLLADLSADPERACAELAKSFDGSIYAEGKDAGPALLETYANQVDLIVVSAQGTLDEANEGAVVLNNEEIELDLFGMFAAWIVYFDANQQAINTNYLAAMQFLSNVEYYLAPIISKDAGDSSTKSMLWFFEKLIASMNPFEALFETRQSLFNYYSNEEQLDQLTVLQKSFALRLYEFVEAVEEDEDDEDEEEDGRGFYFVPSA